jgi:hypothetical protein
MKMVKKIEGSFGLTISLRKQSTAEALRSSQNMGMAHGIMNVTLNEIIGDFLLKVVFNEAEIPLSLFFVYITA